MLTPEQQELRDTIWRTILEAVVADDFDEGTQTVIIDLTDASGVTQRYEVVVTREVVALARKATVGNA
jgi:hypothetical protein